MHIVNDILLKIHRYWWLHQIYLDAIGRGSFDREATYYGRKEFIQDSYRKLFYQIKNFGEEYAKAEMDSFVTFFDNINETVAKKIVEIFEDNVKIIKEKNFTYIVQFKKISNQIDMDIFKNAEFEIINDRHYWYNPIIETVSYSMGRRELLKKIFINGLPIYMPGERNAADGNILLYVVDIQTMRILLKLGANPFEGKRDGKYPLEYALYFAKMTGNYDYVNALVAEFRSPDWLSYSLRENQMSNQNTALLF